MDTYIKEFNSGSAQRGAVFNDRTEEATQKIRQLFQQNSAMLEQGLRCLSECPDQTGSEFVVSISKKLLAHLHSPTDMARIISDEIPQNEQALNSFSEATTLFYNCGDYYLEQCVLSVFLMLFPLYPQPYANYAAFFQRKADMTAAESHYAQLVDSIEDPVLDYFTADCFLKAGNQHKAKELLQRAITKTQISLQETQDLRQHLLGLSERCN